MADIIAFFTGPGLVYGAFFVAVIVLLGINTIANFLGGKR